MPEIKLLVCCHQNTVVPKNELLYPIQVGAALTDERFEGFLFDDTGDNISDKNRSYCELTAQYRAWKNPEADYYGFFHYRRWLYPDAAAKLPYRIEGAPTAELLDRLRYERFAELIEQHDMILPKAEDMHVSVRRHYADAPFHHKKDLDLIEDTIREKAPEYSAAMDEYLSGTKHYFGNIHIMKRQVFERYCEWLFPILEEFDRSADTGGYSPQEQRVDGYLAERLLGVYCTFVRSQGVLKILELPRVHFVPDAAERRKKQFVNALLPPGSRRRAVVKAMTGRSG